MLLVLYLKYDYSVTNCCLKVNYQIVFLFVFMQSLCIGFKYDIEYRLFFEAIHYIFFLQEVPKKVKEKFTGFFQDFSRLELVANNSIVFHFTNFTKFCTGDLSENYGSKLVDPVEAKLTMQGVEFPPSTLFLRTKTNIPHRNKSKVSEYHVQYPVLSYPPG